jgi:hypothetical protein
MHFRRSILRLLAIAAALLLTSCIDGREEFWLNADGSGRADVTYSLPAMAARFHGGEAGVRKMVADFLANTPALKSSGCEVTTDNDRLTIRVRASFDSALDLKKISESGSVEKLPSSANNLAGEITVRVDGRNLDFARTIAPGNALPGAKFMPDSKFEGRKLQYIIHLPDAATGSNATRIEDGGRTLVWDFPLADAIGQPVTTRFQAAIPVPAWMFASIGGVALAVGALTFFSYRKLRGTLP